MRNRTPRPMPANRGRSTIGTSDGIALLMVLWVLTVLMVIVLSFSYMARTETNSTLAFKEGIEKKFLAEAGVERGIVEIFYRLQNLNAEGNETWKTDGTPYDGQLGNGAYTVRITDESGKLDLNTLNDSSGIILKNLLVHSGLKETDADTIVDSILDWKDPDDLHRLHGAESDYYSTLQTPYKAKNSNFDTVEEVLLVKGMSPGVLYGDSERRGIIGFLTVSSRMATVNINAAPKELLTAIPGITPEVADAIIDFRANKRISNLQEVGVQPQSAPFVGFSDSNTFSIESVGHKGDEKKGHAVKAIVMLEGNNNYRYVYYKSPVSMAQ